MKIVGDYNNVSEELKPKKLEKGQVVTYRLLTGVPNPHPESKKERPVLFGEAVTLKTRSKFFDPHLNKTVECVLIDESKRVEKGQPPKSKKVSIQAQQNNGLFSFTGGNIEQEEIYEILELSNENASFKYRDESVVPKFERVDPRREERAKAKKIDALTEALQYCKNMGPAEVREFAASMGWDETVELESLEAQVKGYAFDHPNEFVKLAGSQDTKDKALLKTAISKGIISYDSVAHKIVWAESNTTVATLERVEGKSYLDLFDEWIKTSNNGQNILKSLRKKINDSIKAASEGTKDGEA